MLVYLSKRLLLSLAILSVVMASVFAMIYVIPGDPATIALGPRATEAQKEALRDKMGINDPLYVQAGRFVGQILQGDLGTDILNGRPVSGLIASTLPKTAILAIAGMGWAVLLAIPLGVWSALRPNGWLDRALGVFSTSVIALPSFVVAIYALVGFAVYLKWFPAIGAGEDGDPGSQLRALVLPAFSVGVVWVGYIARLLRASLLEVMGENHVRTFRAFGVADFLIAMRYALPIAMVPVISVIGVGIGGLLSGTVFVEIIFARPGLGSLAYDAVMTRNFPVVLGSVLVATALYVVANLIADLAVAALDPRVRGEL